MTRFDDYPKSIKKAIRYIKQDAPLVQLPQLETVLFNSIKKRKEVLLNSKTAQ
ncbi:hypothetical protein HNP81_000945 [Peribacillus huizhouensis]|uniref:Uncharacterized protein n=1 Tax=Peribacillus huizhouensis TaxID=1501239 RepID=A0ABR6CMQ4_9BACI|nr:hypothetical protein [Peribacillus huizhouensis]